jgi:hypothetical protein
MKRFRAFTSRDDNAPNDVRKRLLVNANPITDAVVQAAGLTEAFGALGARILSAERSRARRVIWRPTRRLVVIGLALLAMLAATGVGLGEMITTHTGFFPDKPGTENDTSEYLRTDAPDFPPLVRKLVKGIPFPPGDSALSRVPLYVSHLQPGPDGIPNNVQAIGIQGHFSLLAVCAWRGYWLDAYKTGDKAAQTLGADRLARVAASDAMKKTDSWWSLYLEVARTEAKGSPSAPRDFTTFYRVNCTSKAGK